MIFRLFATKFFNQWCCKSPVLSGLEPPIPTSAPLENVSWELKYEQVVYAEKYRPGIRQSTPHS